jgi:ornithine cyclodeaminase
VLSLALASTIVAILCFFLGMALIGPTRASIGSMLEPVVSIVATAVLLGGGLTWLQLLGAALVLTGATTGVLSRRASTPAPEPELGLSAATHPSPSGASVPRGRRCGTNLRHRPADRPPRPRLRRSFHRLHAPRRTTEEPMPTRSLFCPAEEVTALLGTDEAIASQRRASQRRAFTALARGTADLPPKIMHASRFDDSVMFCHASRLSADPGAVAKFGSVNPGNPERGMPSVSAVVVVLDPVTGHLVAVLDGTAVTTVRTAAASAVALDALALPGADELGLLGSGTQALAHARAVARVRPLRAVRVWSPTETHRVRVAERLAAELGVRAKAVPTAREAVDGVPMVATCTLSRDPVLLGPWLASGTTVVSIGSVEPGRHEVDARVLRRAAAVVVDDPETAAGHAGPVVAALRRGDLASGDLIPLGEVLTGQRRARTDERDIVLHFSVGLGIQDAAAAWAVVDAALAVDEGTAARRDEEPTEAAHADERTAVRR